MNRTKLAKELVKIATIILKAGKDERLRERIENFKATAFSKATKKQVDAVIKKCKEKGLSAKDLMGYAGGNTLNHMFKDEMLNRK